MTYKMEKLICYIVLCVLVVFVYSTYLQYIAPPQMGWWYYYGWQVYSGKELYKDLYCYLPPYFVWFHALLYKFFGNHLFPYQCLGGVFTLLSSWMIYDLGCRIASPAVCMVACFAGTLVSQSMVFFAPFDYNPIIFLTVVSALYFFVNSFQGNKYLLFVSGIFIGIGIMLKQTMVAYYLAFFVVMIFLRYTKKLQWEIEKACLLFMGILSSVLPGIAYLYFHGTLALAKEQIFRAASAKAYSSGLDSIVFILKRFYMGGFSYAEFGIGIILAFILFDGWSYLNKKSERFESVLYYLLYNLIVFKIFRIFFFQTDFVDLRLYFVANAMYFVILWLLENENKWKMPSNEKHNSIFLLITIAFLFFMVYISAHWFSEVRDFIFNKFWVLHSVRRSILAVSFYFSVFGCMLILNRKKMNDYNLIGIWIFIIGAILLHCTVFLSTAYFDELFSAPLVLLLLVSLFNRDSWIAKSSFVLVSCFIITVTIPQKQMIPYSWHGWTMESANNVNLTYAHSAIDGLSGCILDYNTEIAYENIVSAINNYSAKEESVYAFPHIPLFNVLTERELGTFAVAHYIDVCPDYILLNDLDTIKQNPPRIIIWNHWDNQTWNFHEWLYRRGERSASRDMLEFYEDVVKEQYSLVYQYNNILVWVYNPSNEQNIKFALEELKHVGTYYGNAEMLALLEEMNVNDFPEIRDDEINWSVNECVAKIMMKTEDFNHSVSECDYLKMFPMLKGESMRKWKMTCTE